MYRYVEYDYEYHDTAAHTFVGVLITLIKIFNTFYIYHLKYSGNIDKDKLNALISIICAFHVTLYLVISKLAKEGIPFDVLLVASLMLPMNNHIFSGIMKKGDKNEICSKRKII